MIEVLKPKTLRRMIYDRSDEVVAILYERIPEVKRVEGEMWDHLYKVLEELHVKCATDGHTNAGHLRTRMRPPVEKIVKLVAPPRCGDSERVALHDFLKQCMSDDFERGRALSLGKVRKMKRSHSALVAASA